METTEVGIESIQRMNKRTRDRMMELRKLDRALLDEICPLVGMRGEELPENYSEDHKLIIEQFFLERIRRNALSYFHTLIPELVEDIGNRICDEMIRGEESEEGK